MSGGPGKFSGAKYLPVFEEEPLLSTSLLLLERMSEERSLSAEKSVQPPRSDVMGMYLEGLMCTFLCQITAGLLSEDESVRDGLVLPNFTPGSLSDECSADDLITTGSLSEDAELITTGSLSECVTAVFFFPLCMVLMSKLTLLPSFSWSFSMDGWHAISWHLLSCLYFSSCFSQTSSC